MKKRKSKRKIKGKHVVLLVFLALLSALGIYSIRVKQPPHLAAMSLLAALNTREGTGPDQGGIIEEYEAVIM